MQKLFVLALLITGCGAHAESIPLLHQHGIYLVPVMINEKISLNFTLDSGASDVSIPADVFAALSRAGTITSSDLLGRQMYKLADGSKKSARRFRIRSLRIGNVKLRDVVASVAPAGAGPLLGQSFLERLPNWSINNERHLLVLADSPVSREAAPATAEPLGESHGPKWALISTYDGKALYIDLSDIRKAGTVRRTWLWLAFERQSATKASYMGRPVTSSLFLAAYDCPSRTVRWEAAKTYYNNIERVSTDEIPAERRLWGPVMPGSHEDDELQLACR